MSGCLPTDKECQHGSMINALQNAMMESTGKCFSFDQMEYFLAYLYKEGFEIRERK